VKVVHWKLLLIAAVVGWSVFQVWPRANRPFLNLNLGLDLKGGSYLVMQVQTDDAVRTESDLVAQRLQQLLLKEGFSSARAVPGDQVGQVAITGVPPTRIAEAENRIETELSSWSVSSGSDRIVATMPSTDIQYIRDQAVRQALNTINNRINAFGVGEQVIQRAGGKQGDRILAQLPGVEDPSRVKNIIQTQARLELRSAYYRPDGAGPFRGTTREEVLAQLGGQLPPGVALLPYESIKNQDGQTMAEWWAVEKAAIVTGSDLADARPSRDQWGQLAISFTLRVSAADRFARFTREHVDKFMPIILDDRIKSAPVIRSEIGTNGQIEGQFTQQEAEDLALVLRAGALPARVVTIEERTVGPSLGRDSIQAGIRASLLGMAFVVVFMLVYYKLSGLNAVLALVLNGLILAAAMAWLDATLTLPGIGGFALTVGMAVDANVLIFERIREELQAGKTVRGAIDTGFGKAFSAIFDSNLTTIIAALFLFQYGTGAVQGFAVTLTIGLMASMFTAVFVSKAMFELVVADRPVQTLSI